MTGTTLDLLVSTHAALLQVALNLETGEANITVLHDACPVYFGLTAGAGGTLIAARNIGLDQRVVTPELPCNTIWRMQHGSRTLEPYISHPVLVDLHQIHAVGNWLFVVLGRGSQLAVFDLTTRQLVLCFDLQSVVPPDLCRTDRPTDPYHFNSISSAPGRLFVLAHNWTEGSFALELLFDPDHEQRPVVTLHSVHRGLGHKSHDIVLDHGTLFVLDGQDGILIARGHPAERATLPNLGARPFPRGLIVMPERLVIGYGYRSADKGERVGSPTRLCVLDRENLDLQLDLDLGPLGNPTALAVVGSSGSIGLAGA